MSDIVPVAKPEVLDIQHDTDPAEDHSSARRIPHLGHAILFFALASLLLALSLKLFWSLAHIHTDEAARAHIGIALAAQALAYALTLLVSFWLFPLLWGRSFLQGIQWNALAARRWWLWIVFAAPVLSAAAEIAEHFVSTPLHSPIDDLMKTAHGAWLTAAFGILLAPLTEEIAFRGFLLPALATAYDWLALERTPAGLQKWERSSLQSRPALVFAAIFSSVPFALLHAGQLSHAWGVVGILYCVSLILSIVRIRAHSVACSTYLHAAYNATIFLFLFISTDFFRHLERIAH
jgi:hypothetical protein